jgi:hypothetical protein
MKTKYLFSVLIFVGGGVLASLVSPQIRIGPHGGTVKQAENYRIEMKTIYPDFYAYLLNKNLETISNKNATCEARFLLNDNTTVDIPLQRFGEDAFKAKLTTMDYNSCYITLHMGRNSISAKFENESAIAGDKQPENNK